MNDRLETILKKSTVIFFLAMLCNFLWGSAATAIKMGYSLFEIPASDTAAQIFFAGLRFALAGVLTIAIGSIMNGHLLKPGKSSIKKILILAMLQTIIQYTLFYIGLANTSGVKASVIVPANVFISILVASLLYRQERLTLRKILGCLVGFAGVVLVNLAPGSALDFSMTPAGEGAVLLSTTANSFSNVTMKKFSVDDDPVMLSGYQFILGGLVMAGLGAAFGGRIPSWNARGTMVLVYLAFVSAVAYSLYGLLMKYSPVSKVVIYGFMNPVFSVILSILVLKESSQEFGLRGVAALALVCAGILIVNYIKPETAKDAAK